MELEIPDSLIPKMSLYGQKLALPNAPVHRLAEIKRASYNGTKRGMYRIDLPPPPKSLTRHELESTSSALRYASSQPG